MNPTQQKPSLIFEMLDQVQRQPDHRSRVALLRFYRCFELNTVLQINYRPDVWLDLPPGVPKFQHDNGDPDMSIARTRNVIREFTYLSPINRTMTRDQKLKKFVGILESVNEKEAEVFILVKDRKLQLKWPAISLQVVREAIPGIV